MTTEQVTDNASLRDALRAQDEHGRLQPGESGWWPVWGVAPYQVRSGDAVLVKGEDAWLYVQDTFVAKAAPVRVGWVVDGKKTTLGALATVAVMRRGTHNTLA